MESGDGQLDQPPADTKEELGKTWEYRLRKYLLLLATLVAAVAYAAGFNPPGGVWQDTVTDDAASHLAGDPILRDTHYGRYLVFFYSNATAFASSLVVIVLILLLAVLHEKKSLPNWFTTVTLRTLRVVMTLDLFSLMGAYSAGTCRGMLMIVYTPVLVSAIFLYLAGQQCYLVSSQERDNGSDPDPDPDTTMRDRKVLMLLATFAVSLTYVAGMSAPGGFWDHAEDGYRPGDAILMNHHDARLKAFFVCNTTAFVASLLIVVLLLNKRLRGNLLTRELRLCITVALMGLLGAYIAGSCREVDTTVYVGSLVVAVLLCIVLQQYIGNLWEKIKNICASVSRWFRRMLPSSNRPGHGNSSEEQLISPAHEKARSLVLLLATLAATITYQAGLDPPGGLWQDNEEGHKAGDPILLTTNPRRFKAFYYCNSVAFVASLLAIILVQKRVLLKHHVLEAAMILDLFGLIGAYAAGSCRDISTSIYAMALAGAVLVYVVIHVVFFTLDHKVVDGRNDYEDEELVEKRRKRLLLFAILAATITYQAGLTPPSGFRLQDDALGHHAGDPVLLYNYPRRYRAFFYCNSVSFMLSIALIILLVNPHLYRPAIRSYALSICMAAGLFGLMGAYAAGSTQHLKTSYYIFALVVVVFIFVAVLLLLFLAVEKRANEPAREGARAESSSPSPGTAGDQERKKKLHAKRKYLMLLGILVASVTYQAGLDPPGGAWQGNGDGHAAGDPVMHDNRRHRFLAFFYCNSTSFVASIVVIVLLQLGDQNSEDKSWLNAMNRTIVLDLLSLLGAYATGSSREWGTSGHVAELVFAVLAFVVIHVALSSLRAWLRQGTHPATGNGAQPAHGYHNQGQGDGVHSAV